MMITKEFARPVILSLMYGLPITWYLMVEFLSQYQFHTELHLWSFIITGHESSCWQRSRFLINQQRQRSQSCRDIANGVKFGLELDKSFFVSRTVSIFHDLLSPRTQH
jgi:hypothetical protein